MSRNQEEEFRKVFRIYDDNDNGLIQTNNLARCAEELLEEVTESELDMMVKMADMEDKDGLNIEEFINMMRALGLIPEHD